MKIQLDVCAVVSPNCSETPMWSGTAPKAYQTKAVIPAHMAAALRSRVMEKALKGAQNISILSC
jgi:hypothetical protein